VDSFKCYIFIAFNNPSIVQMLRMSIPIATLNEAANALNSKGEPFDFCIGKLPLLASAYIRRMNAAAI
jgi:hypothetical protein